MLAGWVRDLDNGASCLDCRGWTVGTVCGGSRNGDAARGPFAYHVRAYAHAVTSRDAEANIHREPDAPAVPDLYGKHGATACHVQGG